jgi:hypothetical protein
MWNLIIFLIIAIAGALLHWKGRALFEFWQRTTLIAIFGVIMNACKEWWDCGDWNSIYSWGPITIPFLGDLPFFGPKSVQTGWDWQDFAFGNFGLIAGLGITVIVYLMIQNDNKRIFEEARGDE